MASTSSHQSECVAQKADSSRTRALAWSLGEKGWNASSGRSRRPSTCVFAKYGDVSDGGGGESSNAQTTYLMQHLEGAEAQPLEVDDVLVRLGHPAGAELVGEEEGDAVPAMYARKWVDRRRCAGRG